jgi:VIT1/CCC1 family predicted Fe2+/Mn2+ transporter
MLGVAVGAGWSDLVALAGISAAIAEAVSMGGVLYSSTQAGNNHDRRVHGGFVEGAGELTPSQSGLTTFVSALTGGLVPLAPFAVLPLRAAVVVSVATSVVALFALGSWADKISGAVWWRDGLRLLLVARFAAFAAAAVGTILRVD